MLSILVCSANPDLFIQFRNNVETTIGVEHELLFVNNTKEPKGICAIYNELAQKAQYEILCFVHEDVLFLTDNWGQLIRDTFLGNSDIGLVGLAGSRYKSAAFSGWFTGQRHLDCANIGHKSKNGQTKIYLKPDDGKAIEEVVCLDGVFICCKKEVWKTVRFDEENLKGFHLYDLDFSIRAALQTTVVVTYQINLVHITEGGDFTDNWMKTSIDFHQRQSGLLPLSKYVKANSALEVQIAKATLDALKNYSISAHNKYRWIKLQKLYLHPGLAYAIAKFLLYKPLKLETLHQLIRKKVD